VSLFSLSAIDLMVINRNNKVMRTNPEIMTFDVMTTANEHLVQHFPHAPQHIPQQTLNCFASLLIQKKTLRYKRSPSYIQLKALSKNYYLRLPY
jgi:hypothetical protein